LEARVNGPVRQARTQVDHVVPGGWLPSSTHGVILSLLIFALSATVALAALAARLEAEEVNRPLRPAVGHELDRFPPFGVREQQHCLAVGVLEVEGQVRADPRVWSLDAAPRDVFRRPDVDDLP